MAGKRTVAEWEALAVDVLLDMLHEHLAVTVSEMEARASDRTWNRDICPRPINPHHLGTARQALLIGGQIVPSIARTRGGGSTPGIDVTTWSLAHIARTRAVATEAARKRLLTARHDGWARRGGARRGLIGAAGEEAMHQALLHAGCYANVRHSTHDALGVDLRKLGEVDLTAGLYDDSDPATPVAITLMVEVKNTRHWHYDDSARDTDGDLRRFLRKAATVQKARPGALVCPVVVVRKAQQTLIDFGIQAGFVVASTERQLVLPDHDILRAPEHFDQVRDELGYADLRLLERGQSTTYHRGIATKHIPKNARASATLWQSTHAAFL